MTSAKKTPRRQTAPEAYAERRADIAVLLDCIAMELDTHAKEAADEPRNWGYAGDLGSIRADLKYVLQCFMINRFDGDEDAASHFIDAHLEAMRNDAK